MKQAEDKMQLFGLNVLFKAAEKEKKSNMESGYFSELC